MPSDDAIIAAKPASKDTHSDSESAGLFELTGKTIRAQAVARFLAWDHFRESQGAYIRNQPRVHEIGEDFDDNLRSKVERDVEAVVLQQRKLLKTARFPQILAALGGEERAVIGLAHVNDFLMQCADFGSYYFLVHDAKGGVRVLYAVLNNRAQGWYLRASFDFEIQRLFADHHIVSR